MASANRWLSLCRSDQDRDFSKLPEGIQRRVREGIAELEY